MKKTMTKVTIESFIRQSRNRNQRTLLNLLPKSSSNRLHEAMRYAVLNGGKRIRPLLMYAVGEALHIPACAIDAPAAAVELIHAYSLVHDDLPSMDDDALRRGLPTCHKAYDEATAILVGDALQALAFEALSQAPHLTNKQKLAMLQTLSNASGFKGMVGGQALDLAAEQQVIDVTQLELIHRLKTGTLLSASVRLANLAKVNLELDEQTALDNFAQHIGLAFQIQDDILDVTENTAMLGKTAGHDATLQKATYPALLGLEQAQAAMTQQYDQALYCLQRFGKSAQNLHELADWLLNRRS